MIHGTLATTADAIARGFATNAGSGESNWLATIVMLGCGATVLGLLAWRGWLILREQQTPAAALLRQARRATHLSRSDVRRLARIAKTSEVDHPVTLLLSPSLLQRARHHLSGKDAEAVDRILLRMVT